MNDDEKLGDAITLAVTALSALMCFGLGVWAVATGSGWAGLLAFSWAGVAGVIFWNNRWRLSDSFWQRLGSIAAGCAGVFLLGTSVVFACLGAYRLFQASFLVGTLEILAALATFVMGNLLMAISFNHARWRQTGKDILAEYRLLFRFVLHLVIASMAGTFLGWWLGLFNCLAVLALYGSTTETDWAVLYQLGYVIGGIWVLYGAKHK